MSEPEELDTLFIQNRVDRFQAGDREACEELITKAQPRIERLARKMLKGFPGVGRWEDEQDVTQNVLLRLLRALGVVRPENRRAFYGLAAEQIRRELIDLARHYQGPEGMGANYDSVLKNYQRSDADSRNDPLDTPDQSPSGDELEKWQAFHEAVEHLRAEEREVIGLTYYHGWTQQQIAELFQVDERTIRRYFKSACDRLRDMLGADVPDH